MPLYTMKILSKPAPDFPAPHTPFF
jgi:hypothetical protein